MRNVIQDDHNNILRVELERRGLTWQAKRWSRMLVSSS